MFNDIILASLMIDYQFIWNSFQVSLKLNRTDNFLRMNYFDVGFRKSLEFDLKSILRELFIESDHRKMF